MSQAQPMPPFTLAELEDACAIVREVMPPTPAYAWPLLKAWSGVRRLGKA